MAGLAVGDTMGRPAEGMEPAQIAERWGRIEGYVAETPAGSDDTEYALLTATALLRYREGFTSRNIAELWRTEVCTQEGGFRTGGFSEMAAVHNLSIGLDPPRSGQHSHSWSDGLAMRIAPVGIVCAGDPFRAASLAVQDGRVSHSGEGIYCGQAIAAAVAAGMGGASADEAFESALSVVPSVSWIAHNLHLARGVVSAAATWQAAAVELVERIAVRQYYWADLAPEATSLALAAVLGGDGDFVETVLNAVNLGRDADTIAAMAGGIAGSLAGIDAIPEEWLPAVAVAPGICLRVTAGMHPLRVADDLAALATDGVVSSA